MTNIGGTGSGNVRASIKPPIIVYEPAAPDYYFFDSVEQAERDLESPDIWDEAYIIYDAEGYRIIPEVQGLPPRSKPWCPLQSIPIDPVLLRKRSDECYADELRQLLIGIIPDWLEYLKEQYNYSELPDEYKDRRYLEQLPLADLVQTARSLYAVFEEISARRLRQSLRRLVLTLFLTLVVWGGLLATVEWSISLPWSIALLVVSFCGIRMLIKLWSRKVGRGDLSLSGEVRSIPGGGLGRHRPWQ